MAQMLEQFLARYGATTHRFRDVASARQGLCEHPWDMFILDQTLPDGLGSEFYLEIRKAGVLAPAIMLTGLPDVTIAVQLTRSGLFDYLTKPLNVQQLKACLDRAKAVIPHTKAQLSGEDLIGESAGMQRVRKLLMSAAEHQEATVLLVGATGVGKDLVARVIHQVAQEQKSEGERAQFVPVNCSALPADMVEAELFGAEKGSYTGAHRTRKGLAELADQGTLFLDEITEMPLPLQAKLLHLLETREFRSLGGAHVKRFSGRIMAATNRVLSKEVQAGRFRQDLMYRLDVLSIQIPPLRERLEDVPALADALLSNLARKYHRSRMLIRPEDLRLLSDHDYPGNVRELRNLLERSLLATPSDSQWLTLDPSWQQRPPETRAAAPVPPFPPSTPTADSVVPSTASVEGSEAPAQQIPLERDLSPLEENEYRLVQKALANSDGAIREAARELGISHQALLRRLKKWPELRR